MTSFFAAGSTTKAVPSATAIIGAASCHCPGSVHSPVTGTSWSISPVSGSRMFSSPSVVSTSASPFGPRSRERNQYSEPRSTICWVASRVSISAISVGRSMPPSGSASTLWSASTMGESAWPFWLPERWYSPSIATL